MTDPDWARQAWQAAPTGMAAPSLDEIRARAGKFYRRIRLRNRIEWGACVVVVVLFTLYALFLPLETLRIGAAAVVVGSFVVAWQLYKRASAIAPPEQAFLETTLVHQRAQLARQRDALASIFVWYLLPLLPGLLIMMSAPFVEQGWSIARGFAWHHWLRMAVAPAVFVFVWWLNRHYARKLQAKIDEIDRIVGGPARGDEGGKR